MFICHQELNVLFSVNTNELYNLRPECSNVYLFVYQQELRVAFDQEAQETGNATLLLTAAVAAGKETVDAGYEIDLISQ